VATTHGNPLVGLFNRRNRRPEMDRSTVPAAFGCEILDQCAIASRDPAVLAIVAVG
jgi:hypothetical protein